MKFVLSKKELSKLISKMANTRPTFFDASIATVFFKTDANVVKKIIPKPLKPSPQSFAIACVAKYPKTNFCSAYKEASLSISVEYDGELGDYCLSMPVTDDQALILGRETYGLPNKIADDIILERIENGVYAKCVRRGIDLISLSMSFDGEVEADNLTRVLGNLTSQDPKDKEWRVISHSFKFFQSPQKMSDFEYKPRLIKQITTFNPSGRVKLCRDFDLKLGSSDCDYLAKIPVKKPIMGIFGTFTKILHPGKVVAEVDEKQFMPYAFSKIDFLPE